MLKKELDIQNPLKLMGFETEDIFPKGGFGAVLARAGVGKTALLVQLALSSLFQNKHVLHISLDDSVKKVALWYKEVFYHLTKSWDDKQANQLWETTLPHRFIMTFKVEGFSVPKLEERLTDLKEQDIFSPQVIFIDGFPFKDTVNEALSGLKKMAKNQSLQVWFTIRTHRHETPGLDDIPNQLKDAAEMFEVLVKLEPEGKNIHVRTIKGGAKGSDHPTLLLDPSTMLVKDPTP
ncbi:MAG: AAA family ATPase [Desulfobacterales bacterium]|nr:MAG: AAA family ATPase [Desulfobacterales bacterium]